MSRYLRLWYRLTAVSRARRTEVYHLVAGLLAARLDLPVALEAVASASEARGAAGEAAAVRAWNRALAGARFAEEMALWAPPSEAVVFEAYGLGRSGPEALFRGAARIAELKGMLVGAILRAVGMPVVLVVMLLGLMWGAGGHMLPDLLAAAASDRRAWYSDAMVLLCTGLYGAALPLAAGAVAAAAAVWVSVLRWTGPGRAALDRFPPWSLYRTVTGASFLLSAIELVRAGVDLTDEALARLRDGGSRYAASRIEAIRRQMAAGLAFGKAAEEAGHGFPEPALVPVAQALDGTPRWHEELGQFLDRWIRRSERAMEQRLALLRLGVLAAVALTVAALVATMFDVTQGVAGY